MSTKRERKPRVDRVTAMVVIRLWDKVSDTPQRPGER